MNAKQKKTLALIVDNLRALQDTLREASENVGAIRDEESDKLGNMPDGLRDSEKGERMQTQYDALDTMSTALESIADTLEEVFDAHEDLLNA